MKAATEPHAIDPLATHLRKLMQTQQINEAELARQTHIPQPTLHKILAGKTNDPRASTLTILAAYFEISIDELLTLNARPKMPQTSQIIPIISWANCIQPHFVAQLQPATWQHWLADDYATPTTFALASKSSLEPRFAKGTLLIINPTQLPQDGDIVIAHYPNTQEAAAREYLADGPTTQLLSLCGAATPTPLENNIKILGTLTKSVFIYHPQ